MLRDERPPIARAFPAKAGARKDTFKYRATKFLRRNRLGVAAACVVALSLLAGMLTTVRQARAARREKANAESVSAFLERMLAYSNPLIKASGKDGGETTMKDVLDEAAKRLDGEEFSGQLEVKAELGKIIGESYAGQGRQDLWKRHPGKYIAVQRSLHGDDDPRTIVVMAMWAALLEHKDMAESEKIYRRVLPSMRTQQRRGAIKARDLAQALVNFGYLRRTQGDSKEAKALLRETLALSSDLPGDQYFLVGMTRSTLASTPADQGKFEAALEAAREGVADYRRAGRIDTPDYGFSLTILGGFPTDSGDEAARRLASLYEAWDKPGQAAKYRALD